MENETTEEQIRRVEENWREVNRLGTILGEFSPYQQEIENVKAGKSSLGFFTLHGIDSALKSEIPWEAVGGYVFSFYLDDSKRYDTRFIPPFARKHGVVSYLIACQTLIKHLKGKDITNEAVRQVLEVASKRVVPRISREISEHLENSYPYCNINREQFYYILEREPEWQDSFSKYKSLIERAKGKEDHSQLEEELSKQLFQQWEDFQRKE
jgi:hypothetical protein